MATNVTTLKNAEKTDNLLPRTELKAVFDSDGNYLDNGLKASDLNALKGGVVDELVRFTEAEAGTPVPTDADTLEGHPASYFATADAVTSLMWKNIVTNQVGTAQIPLPTGWKELLAVIHIFDGSTYKVASASFYILSEMAIDSSMTYFRAGHMESSNSSSDISLRVNSDKTWCSLADAVWAENEYRDTSKISVWYR